MHIHNKGGMSYKLYDNCHVFNKQLLLNAKKAEKVHFFVLFQLRIAIILATH